MVRLSRDKKIENDKNLLIELFNREYPLSKKEWTSFYRYVIEIHNEDFIKIIKTKLSDLSSIAVWKCIDNEKNYFYVEIFTPCNIEVE